MVQYKATVTSDASLACLERRGEGPKATLPAQATNHSDAIYQYLHQRHTPAAELSAPAPELSLGREVRIVCEETLTL